MSGANLNYIQENSLFLNRYYGIKNETIFEIKDIHKIKDGTIQYNTKLIKINSISIDKNIYAILHIPSNFDLEKGDIIQTDTKFYKIQNFDDFNYIKYLLSNKIYFKSYLYSLDIIDHRQNKFTEYIDNIR